ncbi:hypothetical protein Q8F55_007272 [Vanrija albida]|uniref:Uncharacterized protein n=1 Tax=Vanrija albida TaxID=181172 RepID=A0ABR3PZY4_9TREE
MGHPPSEEGHASSSGRRSSSHASHLSTHLSVQGTHKVELAPELADVTIKVKTEGNDKLKALGAFKTSASEVVTLITPLAPDKFALGAGSAVDPEWPVRHPAKPAVRWKTGHLSTSSWCKTSRTTRHTAEQSFTVTFHDFSALEDFVNLVTTEKHTEFVSIAWRLSGPTKKALQTEVYGAAILDARSRALDFLAPLVDAPPRLKALDIEEVEAGCRVRYSAPKRSPAKSAGKDKEEEHEPRFSFEPEPSTHSVTVNVNPNVSTGDTYVTRRWKIGA